MYLLPYRLVDDLFDIFRPEIGHAFADNVFDYAVALDSSVKSILVQRSARAVSRRVFYLARGVVLNFAPFAEALSRPFGHVVGRMVSHQQFVGRGLYILGEGRPRFFEYGFAPFTVTIILLLGGVLRPQVVLLATDAGYRYGVDAMMDVVRALLLRILLLQSPHLAEFGGRRAFYGIYAVENRLQVEAGIAAYDAYVDSLTVGEAVGRFGHRETLVFPDPIVQLHPEFVTSLDGVVLILFGCGALGVARGSLDLPA